MPLPPQLAALAAQQGGPFTTAQALAAGYDDRTMRQLCRLGAWTRLRRGVYAESATIPDDAAGRHVLQLRAVLLRLREPTAASHITAAVLHGLALLEPDFSFVHITRQDAASSRTEAGVRHHDASLPPGHLSAVDGVATTSVARTLVDLARASSYAAAVVAAESALHRGLTTRAKLREVLAYCIDWPGARSAGRVVSFAMPFSESPGESLGRIAFDALGLPQPAQQVAVYDAAGFVARVDYLWEEQQTVGEFDGRVKYAEATGSALYDEKLREDRLRSTGLEVFRFGWVESRAIADSIRVKALRAFERAAASNRRPAFRLVPPPAAA